MAVFVPAPFVSGRGQRVSSSAGSVEVVVVVVSAAGMTSHAAVPSRRHARRSVFVHRRFAFRALGGALATTHAWMASLHDRLHIARRAAPATEGRTRV